MLWPLSEYRWRPLLNVAEEIAKMSLSYNLGSKKRLQGRRFRNLEVMVRKRRSLYTFDLVFTARAMLALQALY